MNSKEEYIGDVLITKLDKNNFGPNEGTKTIKGNVKIDLPKATKDDTVTLKNLDIKDGKLDLNFGEGTVILENVKVNNVDVSNVGAHSVYIKGNTEIGFLNIKDDNSDAHIVVEDNGKIEETAVFTGAKLETSKNKLSNKNINPFGNIVIKPSKTNETIVLDGIFQSIKIEEGAKVVLAPSAKITGILFIESGANVEVGENAEVNRTFIAPVKEKENSPIVLKGNLKNVEISKKAKVKIEGGNIQIASAIKNTIEVSKDAHVVVRGNFNNIEATGDGSVNVEDSKEKPSDKCDIESIMFKGAEVFKDHWDNEKCAICNLPAAKTVGEILDGLILSSGAKAEVIDENNNIVNKNDIITENMKIKVTSEDGKKFTVYTIGNFKSIFRKEIEGAGFIEQSFKDINEQKRKVTGKVKFNKAKDESDIQGYYLTIYAKGVHEKEKYNPYNGDYLAYITMIKQVYVPASNPESGIYAIEVLKDYDTSNCFEMYMNLSPVYNNTLCDCEGIERCDISDNIGTESTSIDAEGFTLKDFEDKDLEEGKLGGVLQFTRPKDESNIIYYKIELRRHVGNTTYLEDIGIVKPNGSEVYSFNIANSLDVSVSKDLEISVTAVNRNFLERFIIPNKSISKKVEDLPLNKEIKLTKPTIYPQDENIPYTILVSNPQKYSETCIYVWDDKVKDYVQAIKDGYPIKRMYRESGYDNSFEGLEVGKYKVVKVAGEVKSEMSDEIIIRPMKLNTVVSGNKISVVNALDNATIKLYDKDKKLIKETKKEKNKEAYFENIGKGTYFVTQEMNNIESKEFEVTI